MVKSNIRKIIDFLGECLKESGLNIAQIIILGSYAKGKATGDSDVDIVIISEDFKKKGIFDRAFLTKDAEIKTIRKFLVPLDILTMTPEEWKRKSAMFI